MKEGRGVEDQDASTGAARIQLPSFFLSALLTLAAGKRLLLPMG